MQQSQHRRIWRLLLPYLLVVVTACEPTVDVAGVYFPGWLVSITAGTAASYGIVLSLSWRPATRELADSGILFLALALGVALAIWLIVFSGF